MTRHQPERIIAVGPWGCSSAGRALASHVRGQEFESPHLHHVRPNEKTQSSPPPKRSSKGSVRAVFEAFVLDRKISAASDKTIETYQAQVGPFIKWAEESGYLVTELTSEIVREWVSTRGKDGSATRYQAISRLRTFFRWCAAEGYCADLGERLRLPRVEAKPVQAFTETQIRAMLGQCTENWVGIRNEALIRFLLDTGCRIAEALGIDLKDLDLGNFRVMVRGKGAKYRWVFVGRKTARAVLSYLKVRDEKAISDRLFINRAGSELTRWHARQTLVRIANRAKIHGVRVSPHTFRHTFALMFLKNGGNALTLQRLLGHSTLAMTRRYVNESVDDLAQAHVQASPGDRF